MPYTDKLQIERVRELDRFASLLPQIYYVVNRAFEMCMPQFSKKIGVALWALGAPTRTDTIGPYLLTSDLLDTFRRWSVVSLESTRSEVSKVKRALFELQFIRIEGGRDHIHLTTRGEEALGEIHNLARAAVEELLSVLSSDEQSALLEFTQRILTRHR